MKITNIQLRLLKKQTGNLKAYADITFDETLIVHNVKVVEGKKGLMVSMPSVKMAEKKYVDIVHPLTAELREYLTTEVVSKYQEIINK